MQQSELTLLQSYSKKLEDQNKAKTQQIRLLQEQMSRQKKQIDSRVSVSYCQNCKNKDVELSKGKDDFSKLTKELEELRNKQRSLEVRQSQVQMHQKIVYKEVVKEVESAQLKQDYEALLKEYNNLKKMYENAINSRNIRENQQQKIQWTTIPVNSNDSKELVGLRDQNKALATKIQFLEQRLNSAEESNRELRQQILGLGNPAGNQVNSPFSYPVSQDRPRVWITSHVQPSPQASNQINQTAFINVDSSNIPQQQTVITAAQIPTFRHLPQKSVTFQIPNSTSLSNLSHQSQIQFNYLSPLSVLNPHHSNSHHHHYHHHHNQHSQHRHHHLHHVHNRSQHVSGNISNQSSAEPGMDYYKDIVEERWRSLQYKIKMLQQENGKLRSQVSAVYI